METTWFTPGYQKPDPDGNFHGFRESLVLKSDEFGSYVERRLVHMTNSFALRDSTGNPDLSRAQVLWTMPKRALGRIKDARCVIGPDGHIYAYFRADVDVVWPTDFDYPSLDLYGSGGGTVPQIFYIHKPWGGEWSPVTQVTSDTVPTSSDPNAVLGALQYAVSLTDAGTPVCFIERVKVTYEAYGGGWIPRDIHTALERISAGASAESVSDVLNDIHPTFGNPFEVVLGVGSHKGRAVRFVRRLNSDVPRSSATQPGQVFLFDGASALLDESLDLDSASPGLALFVQGTGTSAVCHVIWRNGDGGRHFAGTAAIPSAGVVEALEAEALVEDSNGNLHALGLHHRVRNAGSWSSPDSPGPVNLIGVGIDALDRIYAL
ncbi:MAG: hypothetical protein IT452_20805, partial [Planctomycetia bacterium]|nr:hypothetical protein [Planctomycetia bacterium]